jgi:hypothetical protein
MELCGLQLWKQVRWRNLVLYEFVMVAFRINLFRTRNTMNVYTHKWNGYESFPIITCHDFSFLLSSSSSCSRPSLSHSFLAISLSLFFWPSLTRSLHNPWTHSHKSTFTFTKLQPRLQARSRLRTLWIGERCGLLASTGTCATGGRERGTCKVVNGFPNSPR